MTDLAELKQRHNKIAEFITSLDDEGRLNLLPYPDFLEKYSEYGEQEKILLLHEFDELFETGRISEEYLLTEWHKIKFGNFISSMIRTLENLIINKHRLKIIAGTREEFANALSSNIPIGEKIITLAELVKNYKQYIGASNSDYDDLLNDIQSELNYLRELQTQQLVSNNKDIQKPKVHESLTSKSENPHPRIFPNYICWQLFNEWRHELNKSDDFSFIYRVMWEDGFIHPDIGPKAFKTWIESTFATGDLGKQLKTLSTCDSKSKYTIYQGKINKYQLHSKTLQKRSINTTKM